MRGRLVARSITGGSGDAYGAAPLPMLACPGAVAGGGMLYVGAVEY